jgi:hypothetical protein
VVVAHFRDGRSAAHALIDLDTCGIPAYGVYVVAASEAGLLSRLGISPGAAGRAGAEPAAEPAAVIVAVVVGCELTADCLAKLGGHALAIGMSAAAGVRRIPAVA